MPPQPKAPVRSCQPTEVDDSRRALQISNQVPKQRCPPAEAGGRGQTEVVIRAGKWSPLTCNLKKCCRGLSPSGGSSRTPSAFRNRSSVGVDNVPESLLNVAEVLQHPGKLRCLIDCGAYGTLYRVGCSPGHESRLKGCAPYRTLPIPLSGQRLPPWPIPPPDHFAAPVIAQPQK